MIAEDNNLILGIDESWSTDYLVAMRGWVLSKTDPVESMEVCVNGVQIPVTWHPRPDILAAHPGHHAQNCGFVVEIPRITNHEALFKIGTRNSAMQKTISIQGSKPTVGGDFSDASTLFNEFIQKVNDERLHVLEIGSRIVSPGSSSKRSLFPNAASYTGFDYYPDANTDVVGDAHQLSKYFGDRKFDAIFSISVFEHLAMPWVVAQEINRVLEVGGITFHGTHNAWPIHEQPWDFWRFSDEALKVLFSPAIGFETIKAGYFEPVRIYFAESRSGTGQETVPTVDAFGGVAILSRKVANGNPNRFCWNATVGEIIGAETHYPSPAHISPTKTEPVQSASAKETEQNTIIQPAIQPAQVDMQSQQYQDKIQRLQKRIKNLKTKLEASENEIAAMKTSKFWQIRSQWLKLKQSVFNKH